MLTITVKRLEFKLKIKQISESHINDEDRAEVKAINAANLKKHKRSWYTPIVTAL